MSSVKTSLAVWGSLALASAGAATKPAPPAVTEAPMTASETAYNTEIFNLLLPGKSLVDGKVHYNPRFARSVDALLAQSGYARLGKPGTAQAFLKKRLLSGPAAKPRSVALQTGTPATPSYLYYRACQAHACDVTNLALLYQPASQRMVALLRIDGQSEHLGQPGSAERALLTALDAAQERP